MTLSTFFSSTLSLRSSFIVSDHVSHPYKKTDKIADQYILIFIDLDSKLDDRISAPNNSKHRLISIRSWFPNQYKEIEPHYSEYRAFIIHLWTATCKATRFVLYAINITIQIQI
jgi:hypothetical protein